MSFHVDCQNNMVNAMTDGILYYAEKHVDFAVSNKQKSVDILLRNTLMYQFPQSSINKKI